MNSMKYLDSVKALCKGTETLVRDSQFCMLLVSVTLPTLGAVLMKLGYVAESYTLIVVAPICKTGQ